MTEIGYENGLARGLQLADDVVERHLRALPKTTDHATFDLLLDIKNEIKEAGKINGS